MGLMEGLISGFGGAATEHQRTQLEEKARQSDLEQRIFSTLAGSTDPEVQALAVQGMLGSAGGKGQKKKGIFEALFGAGGKPSPALGELMGKLSGRAGMGGAPAAQPEQSFVESAAGNVPVTAGANTPAADVFGGETTTVAATEPRVPEPIFKSPAEVQAELRKREREDLVRELETRGASPEAVEEGVYGISRERPMGPAMVPYRGTAIDPYTGEMIYQDPRAQAESKFRSAGGGVIYDESTGRVVYSRPTEGATKDRPEYLDALAAQKQIDDSLKARFGSFLDIATPGMSTYDQIAQAREELAQQFGFESYDALQRQAAFRRTAPPTMSEPPGGGGAPRTIMGQAPEQDQRRMEVILQKFRAYKLGAGPEPSPQDSEFARQYMEKYPQQ